MCPNHDDAKSLDKSNRSDCSIDEERKHSAGSEPHEGTNNLGYRQDLSANGACEALKKFSTKVSVGDVHIGDADNKTRLIERFAGGSFGELYRGELVSAGDRQVAVKIEPQGGTYNSFLLQEGSVYRYLEGGPGIPKVHWFGYHGSDYRALVMDLLGPTLEDLFHRCNQHFSLKTMLLLIDQMFHILEHVHTQNYVHRDISPSNFVLGGAGNETKLYLIDFGHAKRFRTGTFVVPRRSSVAMPRAVVGTPRFISVHAHLSHEEGPRDDLEALGYIIIYLARGRLPWQGVKATTMPEKLTKITEIKMHTTVEELCKGLPEEFAVYINYVRGLKLFETPDYAGIRELFKTLAEKLDIMYDDSFDWTTGDNYATTDADEQASNPISIPNEDSKDDSSPNITPVSR
jgi:serine/threonine protein kinase